MIFSFDTEIAQKYGDRAAYFLGYLQHNITMNKANNRNYFEGRTWSYNSMEAFGKIYSWLTRRQIRVMIDNLVDQGIIKKCNAKNDLGVEGINNQTNAYAFVNEKDWIKIAESEEKALDEKVQRKTDSLDEKVHPLDEKVQLLDGKVQPNNNSLPLITIERENTLVEIVTVIWRNIYLSTPGIVEIDFVSSLVNKFGEVKAKKILYDFKFNNFHSVKTMKESLNDDGTIKPKTDNKLEPKLLTYTEMLEIQNKRDREIFKKAETIKRGDKTYWKLREAV